MQVLRQPRGRAGLALAVVVVAVAIVVGVRAGNAGDHLRIASRGDGRLLVGHVVDGKSAQDREIARGLAAWLQHLTDETEGIPLSDGRVAAVTIKQEAAATPAAAAAAAKRLADRGAAAIVGPADQNQLAEVIEAVRRRPVAVLSAVPRTVAVRRIPQAFHLGRANAFGFATVYDVLSELDRATPRAVTILAAPGRYRRGARSAEEVAAGRGFRPTVVDVSGSAPPRRALARPAAAVLVSAPPRDAVRWMSAAPRGSRVPWVLGAEDLAPALEGVGSATMAVSVPWSPTSNQGDAAEIGSVYEGLNGRMASSDAAAGATLGVLLGHAVQAAKSTNGTRLVTALPSLDVLTPWGQVRFREETSVAPPAQLILLDGGTPRSIFPFPSEPERLRRSVPAGDAPTGAATATPTTAPAE